MARSTASRHGRKSCSYAPAVPLFPGGLFGVLVLIAGGHLLLVRRYPQGLFDLTIGLNLWLLHARAVTTNPHMERINGNDR